MMDGFLWMMFLSILQRKKAVASPMKEQYNHSYL